MEIHEEACGNSGTSRHDARSEAAPGRLQVATVQSSAGVYSGAEAGCWGATAAGGRVSVLVLRRLTVCA